MSLKKRVQDLEGDIDRTGLPDLTNSEIAREDLYYILAMFPYPSGSGMHVGHVLNYTAADILARFKRAQGKKVIFPVGWDSFGLPTENYAREVGESPSVVTHKNISHFRQQAKDLNLSYDWEREIATSSKEYYKWTQWLFLQLYKKGLVYKEEKYVNWDPVDQTVLANDQVVDGRGERSGAIIEQKKIPQWFIKITDYADRLLEGLKDIDYPEETIKKQVHKIGRREGIEATGTLSNGTNLPIFIEKVADLEKISLLVLSPELDRIKSMIEPSKREEAEQYIAGSLERSIVERKQCKNPGFIDTKLFYSHPSSNRSIPVIISDFADQDDPLGVKVILEGEEGVDGKFLTLLSRLGICVKKNIDISSSAIVGTQEGFSKTVVYNLRDWSVGRQRYRGSPIPVLYDEKGNVELVSEEDLPVELPSQSDSDAREGKSPLLEDLFRKVNIGGKEYTREIETLDTFVCSSFYYLRYLDPGNPNSLINQGVSSTISDVDFCIGGSEHATGHLIYARFIHKFLYDIGVVPTEEPFKKVYHQGMIHGSDGRKMSKRFGNGIQPEELLKEYSVDQVRLGIMFMGPLDKQKNWNDSVFKGIGKFINKIKTLIETGEIIDTKKEISPDVATMIDDITKEYDGLKYNVIIAKLMALLNSFTPNDKQKKDEIEIFLKFLAPLAPETAQIYRESLGNNEQISKGKWPSKDDYTFECTSQLTPVTLMIDGKRRGELQLDYTTIIDEHSLLNFLNQNSFTNKYSRHINGRSFADAKIIHVEGRIVNIIFKNKEE